MASAKFLEEALRSDVDESAVNAIVGSLEDQLVTSSPVVSSHQTISSVINQNHLNSAISNGGNTQKHGVANGESVIDSNKINSSSHIQTTITSNAVSTVVASMSGGAQSIPNSFINQLSTNVSSAQLSNMSKTNEGIKLVYPPGTQTINNRVTFPSQTLPNGTIGLSPLSQQTVHPIQTSTTNVHKQPAIVIKTSATPGTPGLVTVPMSVTTSIVNSVGTSMPVTSMPGVMTIAKPLNNVVTAGGQQTMVATPGQQTAIIPNVQIVNVRPGTPNQGQKNMPPRVVLGSPHVIGARQGPITIQSLQQLQPGQQGHLLLKTENGQYQLLRVGPAPPTPSGALPAGATQAAASGTQQTTYRLQTVPAAPTTVTTTPTATPISTHQQQPIVPTSTTLVNSNQTISTGAPIVTQTTPKQSLDNTKEKCRKFLANLLELSSREPKNVEKNVRTLIQELIDMKVEPEEFCDRLERLLNASPQPCLIGFLKKSLPLLRQSLVLKEMVIDGIKPPPSHIVFSLANSTPSITSTVQVQTASGIRPALPTQVRLMAPGGATTVVRPGVQPRLATPTIRGQSPQPRMITTTTLRQQTPFTTNNVIVPASQPPALHPVSGAPPLFPTSGAQVRVACVRPQMQQVRQQTPNQQIRSPAPVRTATPKTTPAKPSVPSTSTKVATKEKEKKSSSFASSVNYAPDDDINDVAAMGGVNLAEETQRILGSTEFVGTQIRSCKDELFLHVGPLQQRLRQITQSHGLEDASGDIAAIVSHATQELLKNMVEKLALVAEHRIEIMKSDSRYEVTHDVRAQLKFLEELDRAERKRHDEQERELLIRAAKSRSKNEDPEQAKLKAKAKEMQRAELEELRQREANLTALQAIGRPKKKPRLDNENGSGSTQVNAGASGSGISSGRNQMPFRPRLKRANLRDLLCLLEQEKDKCKSTMLYQAYLK
ncbi:transcription initiation factor TFIID subunit 4 isoform X2 [Chrysoperla carnea]|uniref:transcription initiation factor TFIID subunit 4 isoform X2 n=1 Tax=Chrysoperla carnea TaxID=189513 RepID=UPI001D0771F1|nr:transcription initiation factor TFIID subunit 4 isoform X2 [Chrysoperla carnea]